MKDKVVDTMIGIMLTIMTLLGLMAISLVAKMWCEMMFG